MTRPYSLAFKQKMVERLTGKDPMNQSQLARETRSTHHFVLVEPG